MIIAFFSISANCFHQFINFATDLYETRFGFSTREAKNAVAMIRFASVILIPVFSVIVTKLGKKGYFLVLSTVFAIFNPLLLTMVPKGNTVLPYFGVVGLCFFWGIQVSSVWPSLSISLPKQAVVIMVGIATCLQNTLGSILPVLFGKLNKPRTPEAYERSLYVLSFLGFLAMTIAVFIVVEDSRTGRIIDIPENDNRVREMRMKLNINFEMD